MNHRTSRSHQGGVTLIEVLVAVLVLSIGLMGVAALQTTSLSHGFSAYQRSQANALAYEMLDRIRADREWLETASNYTTLETMGNAMAAAKLTQGELEIDVSGSIVTITVTWLDNRLEAGTGALGENDARATSLALASRI